MKVRGSERQLRPLWRICLIYRPLGVSSAAERGENQVSAVGVYSLHGGGVGVRALLLFPGTQHLAGQLHAVQIIYQYVPKGSIKVKSSFFFFSTWTLFLAHMFFYSPRQVRSYLGGVYIF